jgi:putative DNA primase/helicase
MRLPIHIDRLRAELTARAENAAQSLLGQPTGRSRGALRFGRKGSVEVIVSGSKAGLWHDYENQIGGDLFDLIEREHRCDFRRAIGIAINMLSGIDGEQPAKPNQRRVDKSDEQRRHDALRLFSEAGPITSTIGQAYLANRGLDLAQLALPDVHDVLRFHPACPFGPGRRLPCIVTLMRRAKTDEPVAIHRTAISPQLTKVGVLSLGPLKDGVIKLWPDSYVERHLAIGEGLETTLSGVIIAYRGPAWAAGSAGIMRRFPVLAGIETLTILVDNDQSGAGQDAARECSARWTAAGRDVIRLIPTSTGDFNDLVRGL